jgi:hypothetical protein
MIKTIQKLMEKINNSSATAREKIKLLDLVEQIVAKRIKEDKLTTKKFGKIIDRMDELKVNLRYLIFDKEASGREKVELQNRINELERERNDG